MPRWSVIDRSGPVVFFGDAGISETQNAGYEWAINGVGNTAGACTKRWAFNRWTSSTCDNIGNADNAEHVYRLTDGKPLFSYMTAGPTWSSTATASGTLLFGSDDGYLYALH